MNKLLAAAIALVALLLTGCSSTPEITAIETTVTVTEPPVTVTKEVPAPAETVVVTEKVPAAPAEEDAVLQEKVMQTTWDDMSPSEQADICMGWDIPELRPMLLDTFVSGAGGMFDRGIAEDFFNEVCG